MNDKFSAKIFVVFKKGIYKTSVIEDYFPESLFKMSQPWETCQIDGCMNCVYETVSSANRYEVIYQLINFVINSLSQHCKDDVDVYMKERTRAIRKLLSGTKLITFELPNHVHVLFNLDWENE